MLLYSLFGASILLVLVCLGLIFVNNNKQSAAIQAKQKQLQETQQQLSILRSEVAEMRAGMLSIGKRVVAVEEKSQELEQLQDAQKYDDLMRKSIRARSKWLNWVLIPRRDY